MVLSCLWEDVSGALTKAHVAPGTIVLDAGNPEAPEIVDTGGKVGGVPATVFYCGDEARATGTGACSTFARACRTARSTSPVVK